MNSFIFKSGPSKNRDTFSINCEFSNPLNKELLDNINKELQDFLTHKETICNNIKEFNRRLLMDIDKLAFPTLSTYLNTKYASTQNSSYSCNVCGCFFPDKRALGSHKKVHKKQHTITVDT